MDVPWDGVREICVTCFWCSSVCVVVLHKRLRVQMDSSGWSWLQVIAVNAGSIQKRKGQFRPSQSEFVLQTVSCIAK